jgi:hypothetical protein
LIPRLAACTGTSPDTMGCNLPQCKLFLVIETSADTCSSWMVIICAPATGWHLPWPHPAAIRVPLQTALIHDAHTKRPLSNGRQSVPINQQPPPGALAALMECAHGADSAHCIHANTWPRSAGITGAWSLLLLLFDGLLVSARNVKLCNCAESCCMWVGAVCPGQLRRELSYYYLLLLELPVSSASHVVWKSCVQCI